MHIIIKGKNQLGKTRSEQETNLRKEWGPTMSDGNLDKIKHLERKAKDLLGSKQNFISQVDVKNVK